MTDAPVAKTFNIADMFSGKAYPKESVDFYTDDETAYQLQKLSKEAGNAIVRRDTEEAAKLQAEIEALVKKGESSRYKLNLTGRSRQDRKNLVTKIQEEFPVEYDFLNRPKPNVDADDIFANRTWAMHIESIEAPDGSILLLPTEADIAVIRGQGADSEIAKVEHVIQGFTEGVKSGFETIAQEHDFLS